MKLEFFASLVLSSLLCQAQYWQQGISYKMDIKVDHTKHQYSGQSEITYLNESPNELKEVYFHLYYNAFQPGSNMDLRSRNIVDPDRRIGDRISKLKEDEIGYHKIETLTQNGATCSWEIFETVMRVKLAEPIPAGGSTSFKMKWNSQIPVQIRRTGRNNIEGIDYSMSQWYPKMAEYDEDGWHAIQYVGREFHGVWGDFDVHIQLDSSYTIGATGMLQNTDEIGKGYGSKTIGSESKMLNWHFKAQNVIDFVWAADRDYIHKVHKSNKGTEFHFFYQNDTAIIDRWEKLPDYTIRCFEMMGGFVGEYPYPQYSVIQGGDGGMEYPMATLILGNGSQRGLVGVTVHEGIHSWFQAVLATNEGKYPWMDEGFNTYYNHLVIDSLYGRNNAFPHKGSYNSYFKLIEKGMFEPISTHSDHYQTNRAYGTAAYSMGCIFLSQLSYIVGMETFDNIMHRYWKEWKFKHPKPEDFREIAESESGMELDWYFNYFLETTKTIDYSIESLDGKGKSSLLHLKRTGQFPMPVDVKVVTDEQVYYYTVPLMMMMKEKTTDGKLKPENVDYWKWTDPEYTLNIPVSKKKIKSIEIDPTQRMADINRSDNVYPREEIQEK